MLSTISHYFDHEKQRFLEQCTACGRCVRYCPIIRHTELRHLSPQTIQQRIMAFLGGAAPDDVVYVRTFACMECFQCVDEVCPQGLNPLHINELCRWEYRLRDGNKQGYPNPAAPDSAHRVLASLQTPPADYERILTPAPAKPARYVFFPGCNVYYQPEKLLTALEIMDRLPIDYAFVPGLDACCGGLHYYMGDIERAAQVSTHLLEQLAAYQPDAVILWCPTCHCRFHTTLTPLMPLPFEIMSFPQFLAQHLAQLSFSRQLDYTVTLHEACKSAFTGVDLTGPRNVLQQLPGVTLREMPRHGRQTMCCGSGAIEYFPKSFAAVRDARLQEAADTDADLLVDVCHYCHEVFVKEEPRCAYRVVNYISLAAEALGIEREDVFRKYTHWGDLDRILLDADPLIRQSPFSRERIIEVLTRTFCDVFGCPPDRM